MKKLRKGRYEYQSNINLQWLCLLISFSFQFSFVPIFINELKPWSNTCKSDALVWGFDLVVDVTQLCFHLYQTSLPDCQMQFFKVQKPSCGKMFYSKFMVKPLWCTRVSLKFEVRYLTSNNLVSERGLQTRASE